MVRHFGEPVFDRSERQIGVAYAVESPFDGLYACRMQGQRSRARERKHVAWLHESEARVFFWECHDLSPIAFECTLWRWSKTLWDDNEQIAVGLRFHLEDDIVILMASSLNHFGRKSTRGFDNFLCNDGRFGPICFFDSRGAHFFRELIDFDRFSNLALRGLKTRRERESIRDVHCVSFDSFHILKSQLVEFCRAR